MPPTHERDVVWISRDQIVARVREANWRYWYSLGESKQVGLLSFFHGANLAIHPI